MNFERLTSSVFEDLVRVVLGAEPDLALAGVGVLDDVLGCALGLLGDLLVAIRCSWRSRASLMIRSASAWPPRASPGAP